jgi:hypothetical protein
MKLSLLFLGWIALATCLGVGFGYSQFGLVPWTAAVSLGLGLLLSAIGTFLSPGAILTRVEKVQATGILHATVFMQFAARAFTQVIFDDDDAVKL